MGVFYDITSGSVTVVLYFHLRKSTPRHTVFISVSGVYSFYKICYNTCVTASYTGTERGV